MASGLTAKSMPPGEDFLHRGPGAAECHAGHLDAGLFLELLRQQFGHRSGADFSVIELARLRLGVSDEFLHRIGGRRLRNDEGVIGLRNHRNRRKVFQLVGNLLVKMRVRRIDIRAQKKCVSVARLSEHVVERDHAGGAGLVLDHHRLAERGLQFLADDARRHVARSAGRKSDQHFDRPVWKVLRHRRYAKRAMSQ